MRNVALDLGAKKIAYCEVVEGRVVERRTVRALSELGSLLGPNTPKAQVAIEACREAWHVHDELEAWGHEVLLVDTTRVAKLGIGRHGRKTDRVDAEVLARAVEARQIPRAHVLSPARRALRTQVLVRRALVETRSQYITSVRGLLRAEGVKFPACEAESFVTRFREAKMGEEVREACAPLVTLLSALEPQIALVEGKVQQLAAREPATELLMTVPGVGVVVAASFVSVIDDAKRFARAHQVESYLGLVPSEDSSGGKRRIGAISKAGNPYLRALLVQSAWTVLRSRNADPLKTWAEALAARRGKRVAIVALARRLAGVLWALWRDGTVYDPGTLGRASVLGTAKEAQTTQLRAEAIARAAAKAKVFARRRGRPQSSVAMEGQA